VILFIIRYWKRDHPPVGDLISPLFTLILAFGAGTCIWSDAIARDNDYISICEWSPTIEFVTESLVINSLADFITNTNNIKQAIVLFSFGHLMMQGAYMKIYFDEISLILILISVATVWFIFYIMRLNSPFKIIVRIIVDREVRRQTGFDKLQLIIGGYAIVLVMSFIQVSRVLSTISIGYILLIISNLIIVYEIMFIKIHPRQIRTILAPVLYLISQHILTRQLIVMYK